MIRSFNYTKRKAISKDRVSVSTFNGDGKVKFTASIFLDGYGFPSDAQVYVEAYYGPSLIRFHFGTVSGLKHPESCDVSKLFEISERVYFRLKVVDGDKGLILGMADKISLANDTSSDKSSIFFVNRVQLDTNEIWRVSFETDEEGSPVLELNSKVEGISEIARAENYFLALVYPAAIRIVLARIAELNQFEIDGDSWYTRWIKFTRTVLGVTTTPENNEDPSRVADWSDEVVRAFCIKNSLLDRFSKLVS